MHHMLETTLIASALRLVGDGDRFRRIDGNPQARVIYFLPWNTPLSLARMAGFIRLDYLACYEMPRSIVSPIPANCIRAVSDILDDVEVLAAQRALDRRNVLLVGMSIGNFPATVIANRWRAPLCSVCSADRAAHMIWESSAAQRVREDAERLGYRRTDFEWAFRGHDPIDNLAGIAGGSGFFVSLSDPFVPVCRTEALIEAVKMKAPEARVVTSQSGHFGAMLASCTLQAEMASRLGIVPASAP